ncbi:uncharacterized protein LOC132608776 [Lycium barbarum]|uniref:uncharacterized protein LOC132608776 n=1 Tax=Lycium barbarum TaxID=112863 RepID=UPI00293EC3D9|nr:uncharacterized protein LOC132608776 [Lycium barbarum]
MENPQNKKLDLTLDLPLYGSINASNKSLIWDCESSLYDSFELKSIERQLHSALTSRTLSLPHLLQPQRMSPKKCNSKIARSFQKLLKFVFRHKENNNHHLPEVLESESNLEGTKRIKKSRAIQ